MNTAYSAWDAKQGVDLPPFNEHSTCVKCGSQDVNAYHVDRCSQPDCSSSSCDAEHIRRTCRRCGFVWPEATLEVARLSGEGDGT